MQIIFKDILLQYSKQIEPIVFLSHISVYKLCNISYTYPCMFYFHSLLFFPSSKFQKLKLYRKGQKLVEKPQRRVQVELEKMAKEKKLMGFLKGFHPFIHGSKLKPWSDLIPNLELEEENQEQCMMR